MKTKSPEAIRKQKQRDREVAQGLYRLEVKVPESDKAYIKGIANKLVENWFEKHPELKDM